VSRKTALAAVALGYSGTEYGQMKSDQAVNPNPNFNPNSKFQTLCT